MKRSTIIIGLPIIFFLVFHKPIEILIDAAIIELLFKYVESSWYNDLIIATLAIYISSETKRKLKKTYTPSATITALLFQIAIIYSFYRIGDLRWSMTSFQLLSQIKYLDIVYVMLLSNIVLLIPKKHQTSTSNELLLDESIGFHGNDLLGYKSYARIISDRIKENNVNKAFAFGINGKWGLGKTSFLDLIKRNLNNENDIIEINFNAWNSSSPESIIVDFFYTLEESLKHYNQSLPRLIRKYLKKLLELYDNSFFKGIDFVSTVLIDQKSINSIYEEINHFLKMNNRKLVIYIDDLDRLDKDEIVEVIRLIRNTANFYNTFFIVAYDRNYVINALKNHTIYNSEEFLEKIFQMEITLPFFRKEILVNRFEYELKLKLPESLHNEINESTHARIGLEKSYLEQWLESLRDVSRLVNSVFINIENLKGEVRLYDMLRIELLRLKFPTVYELLYRKTHQFLEGIAINDGTKRYYYKLKDINENNLEIDGRKINYEIDKYVSKNHSDLSVRKIDIPNMVKFLSEIFPDRYDFWDRKQNLSVVHPSKFHRYFNYGLLAENLSEIEFSTARTSSVDEFKNKIEEWAENDLAFEIQTRLIEINSYDNSDDFKTIISGIFHLANQPNNGNSSYYFSSRILGYYIKNLIEKISNYSNQITDTFFLGENGLNEYKSFIRSFFLNAKSPYEFESQLIKQAIDEHFIRNFGDSDDMFPLSKNELVGLNTRFFQRYCEENDKINDQTWNLYRNSHEMDYVPQGGNSYSKESLINEDAVFIFKEIAIKKDLEGFLSQMIIKNTSLNQKKLKYGLNSFVLSIYESEEFETVLNESVKTLKINEFVDFYKKLNVQKQEHKTDYVEYEFKEIVPS